MKLWIQLHDYTSKELDAVNISQAKEALSTFDWKSELTRRDKVGRGACDPGFGLISEDESILHICPRDSENCYIHYHYDVQKKILGFIPSTSQETHYIETCSYGKAAELIEHHFNGKADEILKTQ